MANEFNADEVFRIAEQIEKNGGDFYGKIAEKAAGDPISRLFKDLASMEKEHEKAFSTMRSALSDQEREGTTFDPGQEGTQYLEALAGISVLDDRVKKAFSLIATLSGDDMVRDGLKAAIDLEKDSVVFYLGMKEMVPERLGKDKLDWIIKEEMRHIRILGARLLSLKK
ncbi:MAG: rubrerythrin [Desulfobacteraceae bacterium]|nr:MAG: rubrerythrin [Desulfobacteraceae bacterium]